MAVGVSQDIREEFCTAFGGDVARDIVKSEDIESAYVSEDNTISLIDTSTVEDFGCTQLSEYHETRGGFEPARVYDRDGERKASVYAVEYEGTCLYSCERVDAIGEFLGVSPAEMRLSVWKVVTSDVGLLMIDVPDSTYAVILAPHMAGEYDEIRRASESGGVC